MVAVLVDEVIPEAGGSSWTAVDVDILESVV